MEWLFYNHISQSEVTVLQLIFSVLMFIADWCEVHSSIKQGSKNQVKEDIRVEITGREKNLKLKLGALMKMRNRGIKKRITKRVGVECDSALESHQSSGPVQNQSALHRTIHGPISSVSSPVVLCL